MLPSSSSEPQRCLKFTDARMGSSLIREDKMDSMLSNRFRV